jgi:hypothetical protein
VGNTGQGICSICRNEKRWSHILRFEGARGRRGELVYKIFTSIDEEIGIRRMVANKIKRELAETELYSCGEMGEVSSEV